MHNPNLLTSYYHKEKSLSMQLVDISPSQTACISRNGIDCAGRHWPRCKKFSRKSAPTTYQMGRRLQREQPEIFKQKSPAVCGLEADVYRKFSDQALKAKLFLSVVFLWSNKKSPPWLAVFLLIKWRTKSEHFRCPYSQVCTQNKITTQRSGCDFERRSSGMSALWLL